MSVGAHPGCTLCPLHQTAGTVGVRWRGTLDAEVLVVGDAPDEAASSYGNGGSPFVGKAGRVLAAGLRRAGFRVPEDGKGRPLWDRTDVLVTYLVNCRPPGDVEPEAVWVKACAPYLNEIISKMPNLKVIVGLGNIPLAWATGRKGITARMGVPVTMEVPDYNA